MNTNARLQMAWKFYLGALFTLPLIGLGVLRLTTGRDWGAGLQLSWVLLAIATVLILPELFADMRQSSRRWMPVVLPMTIALGLSMAGLWIAASGEPLASAVWRYGKQVIQLVVMLFFVLLPLFFIGRGYALRTMARVIIGGACGQLIYSLGQGVHFYFPWAPMSFLETVFTSNPAILAGSEQLYSNNALLDIPRLRGTACEPLYLGNYLLLVLPLVGLSGWRLPTKLLLSTSLFTLLILTWSRGAWLAGLVALMVFLVLNRQAGRRRVNPLGFKIGVAVILLGLLAVGLGRPEPALIWSRLGQSFSTVDWSNLTRLYSMQAAWRAFLLSPVVGVGWGQFGFHFAALVDPMGLQSMFTWPVVNNFPLAVLCETGILGVASTLWAARALGQRLCANWNKSPGPDREIILLLAIAVLGVCGQMLTFSQYNLPHIWVSLGLLIGQLRRSDVAPVVEAAAL